MTSSWTGTTTSTMSRNTFSPPSQPLRPPVSALPEMSYKPPSPAYVSYDQQQRMPSASPNYPHHTHHNARAGPVGYSPHRSAPPSMNHNRPAYAQMPGFPATPSYQAYAQQGGYGSRLDPHSAKFSPAMSMPNMLPGAMGTKGGNMKRAPMPLDGYIYQVRFLVTIPLDIPWPTFMIVTIIDSIQASLQELRAGPRSPP
ncbi:hypothetical protein EON64_08190 [archaeon]|nr:MAG: hypothetical protein EON64_08190 [archaeon]